MNLIRTAMLLAAMTAIFMLAGYALGGQTGVLIAFFLAAAMNFYSYWNGDKLVLRMHQAVEVGPENAPEFHEIVRRLAQAAQLPMPRTYIINSPQPNAFATGRNPQNAAVAATTGLLETLEPAEVAGVMAHELAHIASRDTLTMTITATLAGAISMLGNFAFFMGGSRQNRGAGVLGSLFAIMLAPLAAAVVQMAISRTREYSADRLGAQISGEPLWLASALGKIASASGRIPNFLAEQHPATAHMFIINPLGQYRRDSLFSTHPDPANRIAALTELDRTMKREPAQTTRDRPVSPPAGSDQPSGPWGEVAKPPKARPKAGNPWGRQGSEGDDGSPS